MSTSYLATATPAENPGRQSIGGRPYLPVGTEWPVCPKSGKRMVLFFQFDLPDGLAQPAGSHLLAFMSPAVNEIHSFEMLRDGAEVTDAYWAKREPHFAVLLYGPEVALVEHADADPYLEPHALSFATAETKTIHDPFLFVGGTPRWYQDPEHHPGFEFIAMLSENYPFAKRADAPKQPDSFSSKAYCLFLGNACYLFARARPARPDEVFVVLQN